jgi:hypothetical protein
MLVDFWDYIFQIWLTVYAKTDVKQGPEGRRLIEKTEAKISWISWDCTLTILLI